MKALAIEISEKLLEFFIRWRRMFFIPSFFILVFMEAREITDNQPIHYLELSIYFSLIIVIALLIELLLRAIRLQNRVVKILDYKNQISRELIDHEHWEDLDSRLIERLARMADVKHAQLFLWEPVSQEFSLLKEWKDGDMDNSKPAIVPICEHCMNWKDHPKLEFGPCRNFVGTSSSSDPQAFCLPVYYQEGVLAQVRFILEPNQTFDNDQLKTLDHLGDEIAIALTSGQDRRRLLELQMTQAAIAERRSVSQYLHDNLGQNIGYLKMKLDQFSSNPALLRTKNGMLEIQRMKETAEEAYTIVRNKLESSQSLSTPTLASYLREHAQRISERAGFEYTFTTTGNTRPISMDAQRAIFYVFQEALSNIEKHAKADKVDIVLGWGKEKVALTISDNGVGFNPKTVDSEKHFGLGIVRERLANVNGRIEIHSTETSGTIVKIIVPLLLNRKRE